VGILYLSHNQRIDAIQYNKATKGKEAKLSMDKGGDLYVERDVEAASVSK